MFDLACNFTLLFKSRSGDEFCIRVLFSFYLSVCLKQLTERTE